jgi:hypothetical protein
MLWSIGRTKSMNSEKKALMLASLAEAITGLIALIDPLIVAKLLFDAEIAGVAIIITRVTGAGLLGLGVSCWPGSLFGKQFSKTLLGMLIYNLIVTIYFGYLGITGQWVGLLLWPAIFLHAFLTFLLCLGFFTSERAHS